jgi:hypothetical protein
LKSGTRHVIDLSRGNDFEDSRERRLGQANRPFLFGFDNEQVGSVKRARGLDIDAVPPSVRISDRDGTPAHQLQA